MTVYKMGGFMFVSDDFQSDFIKEEFDRRSDIKELMKIVGHTKMYALSKSDFINQLKEFGCSVKWNDDNIQFTMPNGNIYLNTELNFKEDWFDIKVIENQIEINLGRYIDRLMRKTDNIIDFIELLKDEQAHIFGVKDFSKNDVSIMNSNVDNILKAIGLDYTQLNNYYDLKNDKKELRNAIWQCSRCALSKSDFISKMEQLGYKVDWKEDKSTDKVNELARTDMLSNGKDIEYNGGIEFVTPMGNIFDSKTLGRPELYSAEALLNKFQNNNIVNDFDILIDFLHLFSSNDTPVSSAMSLVGSDLNGEKLREFMYHFERGSASIYNKNLNNDLSM